MEKLGLAKGVRAPCCPPCLGTSTLLTSCSRTLFCQGKGHLLSGVQQALNTHFLDV
jgi:hypothetical protein